MRTAPTSDEKGRADDCHGRCQPGRDPMNVLVWHVHGSWMTAFVQGPHRYLVPKLPEGAPWGLGRAGRDWAAGVVEVSPADLIYSDVDVVVAQRVAELELAKRW